jgi:hypothetical protein
MVFPYRMKKEKNVTNLCYHKDDCDGHYVAFICKSSGKGACDGNKEMTKRLARMENLQNPYGDKS